MGTVIDLAAVRAARQGSRPADPPPTAPAPLRSTGARASAGTGGPRTLAAGSTLSSMRPGGVGAAGPPRSAARAGTWTCPRPAPSPERKPG